MLSANHCRDQRQVPIRNNTMLFLQEKQLREHKLKTLELEIANKKLKLEEKRFELERKEREEHLKRLHLKTEQESRQQLLMLQLLKQILPAGHSDAQGK